MSQKTSAGTTTSPAAMLTSPFGDVRLTTPLLQLAQQLLGPFLAHKRECTDETCVCGLTTAVEELRRRELLVTRYGTSD